MSINELPAKFFLVKVTGGQEENVAKIAELKVKRSNGRIKVKSIILPPKVKGMLIVEAESYTDVLNAFEDIKHFKRIIPGIIEPKEIEKVLVVKKEEEFNIGDIVEVVSGPFKGMVAKIINIRGDSEAVIQFQDSSVSPIPIVISKDYLKKLEEGS